MVGCCVVMVVVLLGGDVRAYVGCGVPGGGAGGGGDGHRRDGGVAEVRLDGATGVASAWLVNGVRVHAMELVGADDGLVHVFVSFAGGRMVEGEGGLLATELAAQLVEHPPFDGMLGGEVPAWLSAQGIEFFVFSGESSLSLTMAFAVEKTSAAMGVLERFVLGATVRGGGAFASAREELAGKQAEVNGSVWRGGLAFASAALSGDERFGLLDPAEILGLGEDDVRGALDRHFRSRAGVEAAIVGPMDVGEGVEVLSKALGGLGERDRVVRGADACDWRLVEGRHERAIGEGGFSTVVVGVGALGPSRTRAFRVARATGMVLEGRLQRALADRGDDDESVEVLLRPWGRDAVLLVVARVPVGGEDAFIEFVRGEIVGIGAGERDDAALAAVLQRLSETADRFEGDGRYWSGVLGRLDSSGYVLREIAPARAMYGSMGWDEIAAYARGAGEGRYGRTDVVVRPERAETLDADEAE